ncbi:response regulator transcription factor [Tessaracoccus massiliensis]|uniref:response regulator transcription factor n=1 Tax=Tessaracoccus massiliensis TaxID=1522311 RepID=UPI001FE66384|nr:response regulator transcription factor [Tessaracoccus massiliensis]
MIRVLLVDDHPVVRSGVAALLGGEASIEVVGAAATGEEALRLVEDLAPDVVLCDLRSRPMWCSATCGWGRASTGWA